MKKSIFILVASTALATSAFSQTTTASVPQTVTLNLQDQIDLSIQSATGTTFSFSSPDDYANGVVNADASTIRVRSNKPWALTVKSGTANFTGGAGTMPASKLLVSLNTAESYAALSTTEVPFTTGSRGVSNVKVDYKADPGFGYDSGSYTISVVYTATQQ